LYPDERRILMTPGPVVFSVDVLRVMASTIYEHTSPDFAVIHGDAIRRFRAVVGAREGSPVFIIPGSGTLAMEVSLLNTVNPGSRVLVVSHGFFGDRWGEIARANGYDVTVLSSEPGGVVGFDSIVEELSRGGYGAVLVSHVETSTGVRSDLERLASIARKFDVLLLADGVSSVAAEPLNCSGWGVDVVVTASQKALEVPPGLGLIALCSERAVEAFNEVSGSVRGYYSRLSSWAKVMEAYERGEVAYYATPATHLVVALAKSLEKILAEGLERRFRRHAILAKALRRGLRAMGLEIVAKREEIAANTVTAVYTPENVSPVEIRKAMIAGNITVAMPIHPALRGRSIRIGHMGAVNHNDIVATIALLERTLKRMGANVKLGAGLQAVQEALYEEGV
jgi:Serine-pyruvate aminotransferase/archaeal aspartate aminotransferase